MMERWLPSVFLLINLHTENRRPQICVAENQLDIRDNVKIIMLGLVLTVASAVFPSKWVLLN